MTLLTQRNDERWTGGRVGDEEKSCEEDYRDVKRGVEKVEGMDEGWKRGRRGRMGHRSEISLFANWIALFAGGGRGWIGSHAGANGELINWG